MTHLVKENRFLEEGSKSGRLHERATKVMPGGSTRQTVYFSPHPYYASRGHGCFLVDEEGEERIDFTNNITSLILGHAHPAVLRAVSDQLARGSCFAAPTESEIRLAEILTERVDSVESVRFTNSGTEAVITAIKAARVFTGKPKIAKFEGCFNGSYDYVEVSLEPTPETGGDPREPRPVLYPGNSPSILDDVVVLPFNDIEAAERILSKHRDTLAALVVDPVPNRAGLIPARPGFLASLREFTRRLGILLISDEVITFRLSRHGAQHWFGYDADLTTFGKIIGGGFPVGALGGSAEVMSVFDSTSGKPRLPHYGTFNANPVTMVAGAATLEELTPASYEHLNRLGDAVRDRLNALFHEKGFEAQVTGAGSIFRILMTAKPLSDYRSAQIPPERRALIRELFLHLLGRGVALTTTLLGSISMPMTMTEVDRLVEVVAEWVRAQ